MSDCLVTQLKGTVGDEYLPRLGELYFDVVDKTTVLRLQVRPIDPTTTFRIVGDGYFTDADGAANLGKTFTNTSSSAFVYASPGTYRLFIPNKGIITEFTHDVYQKGIVIDVDNIRYCSRMESNYWFAVVLKGDVMAYIKSCPNLTLFDVRGIQPGSDLYDISMFAELPDRITSLRFTATEAAGKCVFGDISVFNNSKVKFLSVGVLHVYGDISLLPCAGIEQTVYGRGFRWDNERPSDYYILGIIGSMYLGDDVDKMLINQAKCVAYSDNEFFRTINVIGTHDETNAEAVAAIATLQDKGYTVTITAG